VRYDSLYDEAISKIRGITKEEEEHHSPDNIGNRLMSSTLMATGFGQGGNAATGISHDPSKNNIRVKFPMKDDDDNFSEGDNDAEKKIKLEAQLRYDKMAKTKMKTKMGSTGMSSGGPGTSSAAKLKR
jgi:hypothetical protein